MNAISKINYAIYNDPSKIQELFNLPNINNGFIKRILTKAIPCRLGIEFEYSGSKPFKLGFVDKYKTDRYLDIYKVIEIDSDPLITNNVTSSHIRSGDFIDISNRYEAYRNCHEYVTNLTETYNVLLNHYNTTNTSTDLEALGVIESSLFNAMGMDSDGFTYGEPVDQDTTVEQAELIEIRFSFNSYKHLIYLYKFMEDMKEFCELDALGGIHIHVDISNYLKIKDSREDRLKHYLTNRLPEIESIFPKYKGKYNKRKIGIGEKGTYVNISRLNTLEFRIAPLTFSYSELMRWIRGVIKLRSEVIHDIYGYHINKESPN